MTKRKELTPNERKAPRAVHETLSSGKHFRTRVMVLHPGSGNDTIRCDLEVYPLKRLRNTYEAVSYVWGDPDKTVDIECNGSILPVTVNLADALRHFRYTQRRRRLWVDAICINQSDNQEKSQQVARMGQVYKHAKRVLVWLGSDDDGFAWNCFRLIKWVNEYLDAEYLQRSKNILAMPSLGSPLNIDQRHGKGLVAMISLPWFFRVWTVQECALAKICQLYWGTERISIEEVMEFSFWCAHSTELSTLTQTGRHHRTFRSFYIMFENLHQHYKSKGSWHSSRPGLQHSGSRLWNKSCFALVLYGGHMLEATDARDRVYAFLGNHYARDDMGKSVIEPDYSISMDRVYYRVAQTLLRDPREGRQVLRCVGHETREDVFGSAQWPSWVPHWSKAKEHATKANPYCRYEAGGPIDLWKAASSSAGLMNIQGFVFDTVIYKSSPVGDLSVLSACSPDKSTRTSALAVDALWAEFSTDASALGVTVDYDAFILTLFRGYFRASFKPGEHLEDMQAFRKISRSQVSGASEASTDATLREVMLASWAADMLGSVWSLSLILTEYGGVGLVTGGPVRAGDVCCIFLGAEYPFILAPVEDGYYRLVTDAYIHGVMGGELVGRLEAYAITLE